MAQLRQVTVRDVDERIHQVRRDMEQFDKDASAERRGDDAPLADPLQRLMLSAQLQALEQERKFIIGPFSAEFITECAKRIAIVFAVSLAFTLLASYFSYQATGSAVWMAGIAYTTFNLLSYVGLVPCLLSFRSLAAKYTRGAFMRFFVWVSISYFFAWTYTAFVETVSFSLFVEPIVPLVASLSGQELAEWVAREVPASFLQEIVAHPHYETIRGNFYTSGKSAEFCDAIEKIVRRAF